MTDAAPREHHAWRPARFMVIAAHPDDADFGPAGTAARWIDEGSEGWLVCCTSGDQGGEELAHVSFLQMHRFERCPAVAGHSGNATVELPVDTDELEPAKRRSAAGQD